MATVQFLLKSNTNPATIYVRLRDGRETDVSTSTTKTIDPKYWTDPPKKKKTKKSTGKKKNWIREVAEFADKMNLSNDLIELKQQILVKRNKAVTNSERLDLSWLERVVLSWRGENSNEDSDFLVDRMRCYKEGLPTKVKKNGTIGVSLGAIRNYNTTIQRIMKFEGYKKEKVKLTSIDISFHADYIKYARERMGLSLNSIGKDITQIKTVCRDSKDHGFEINEQVFTKSFSSPSEKTLFVTLNESELKLINNFEGSDYLMNAKDWLIIGCYTGCRVGDLMNLNMNNVSTHVSGNKIIEYTQSKTDKDIKLALHPMVQQILLRLDGFPRPITDQRFNDYIKEVCRIVGLVQKVEGSKQSKVTKLKEVGYFEKWELIKSHTCRRSFATNHYTKLSNKSIMAATGHATEKMLLAYIGEVEDDHIEDYVNLWSGEDGVKHLTPSKKNIKNI
jgi:integrase